MRRRTCSCAASLSRRGSRSNFCPNFGSRLLKSHGPVHAFGGRVIRSPAGRELCHAGLVNPDFLTEQANLLMGPLQFGFQSDSGIGAIGRPASGMGHGKHFETTHEAIVVPVQERCRNCPVSHPSSIIPERKVYAQPTMNKRSREREGGMRIGKRFRIAASLALLIAWSARRGCFGRRWRGTSGRSPGPTPCRMSVCKGLPEGTLRPKAAGRKRYCSFPPSPASVFSSTRNRD